MIITSWSFNLIRRTLKTKGKPVRIQWVSAGTIFTGRCCHMHALKHARAMALAVQVGKD